MGALKVWNSTTGQWEYAGGGGWVPYADRHQVRMYRTSAQTGIAHATTTVVQWQAKTNEVGGIGDVANNRVNIARDGFYTVRAGALVDPSMVNGVGYALMIRIDGSAAVDGVRTAGEGAVNNPLRNLGCSAPSIYLTAGQQVEVTVFHNKGSGQTIDLSPSTGSNNHWGTFLEVVENN